MIDEMMAYQKRSGQIKDLHAGLAIVKAMRGEIEIEQISRFYSRFYDADHKNEFSLPVCRNASYIWDSGFPYRMCECVYVSLYNRPLFDQRRVIHEMLQPWVESGDIPEYSLREVDKPSLGPHIVIDSIVFRCSLVLQLSPAPVRCGALTFQ